MANKTVNDANFPSELNQTSKILWPRDKSVVVLLLALNIFLSITASLGNALILVVLHKESSIHPPTKLLFRCLAVTDLCVGLITQPLFTVYYMSFVTTGMNWNVIYYIDRACTASSFFLCGVSVFTSSAISVDRLLALLLGLRYRHVVTLRRVRAVIILFWLIGVSFGSLYFWKISITFTVAFALIIISLVISVVSYTKIYLKLQHHQLQVHTNQGQPNVGRIPLNIARYKKTVSSVSWVQMALVTCYVPFIIVAMLITYGQMSGNRFEIAHFVTITLTYLNSSLNPILYCWRIGALRQAAKDMIKQLICCKSD
ncbi:adenosine receptor A3-like [Oculina patagonica]